MPTTFSELIGIIERLARAKECVCNGAQPRCLRCEAEGILMRARSASVSTSQPAADSNAPLVIQILQQHQVAIEDLLRTFQHVQTSLNQKTAVARRRIEDSAALLKRALTE